MDLFVEYIKFYVMLSLYTVVKRLPLARCLSVWLLFDTIKKKKMSTIHYNAYTCAQIVAGSKYIYVYSQYYVYIYIAIATVLCMLHPLLAKVSNVWTRTRESLQILCLRGVCFAKHKCHLIRATAQLLPHNTRAQKCAKLRRIEKEKRLLKRFVYGYWTGWRQWWWFLVYNLQCNMNTNTHAIHVWHVSHASRSRSYVHSYIHTSNIHNMMNDCVRARVCACVRRACMGVVKAEGLNRA